MAGVSAGTVDRVLHNRGRVSEEALQKVLNVLNQIDYKPNLIARSLGAKKNYRIAVLVPNPDQDPYWALCSSGIEQAIGEWVQYGITVETHSFDFFDNSGYEAIARQACESAPDGMLIAPIYYHETLPIFQMLKQASIPYVLFNTNIPEAEPLSFIGQDLYQSGKVGAELLCIGQEDHGTLAVFHIYEDIQNSIHLVEKEKGFRKYIEEKKKGFNVVTIDLASHNEAVIEEKILPVLHDPLLKGIYTSTSSGSFLVASFLEKHNKGDIRLVGYDMLDKNLHYLKSGTIDFLINQNPKRQAFLGISHLANHLLFRKEAPTHSLFPLEVITQQNVDSYLKSAIL